MKKIILIVLSVMLLAFVGCKKADKPADETTPPAMEESTEPMATDEAASDMEGSDAPAGETQEESTTSE